MMYDTWYMKVSPICLTDNIDLYKVREILTSNKISQNEKIEFIRANKTEIEKAVDVKISAPEFKWILKNRPLRKFRPFKNSFTKRGDRILLANLLDVEPTELDDYLSDIIDALGDVDKLNFLPKDKLDAIKTYIYRHGSKDEIVSFLDYELTVSKDILKTLYTTLEYHTGGLADYFIRPIHRMSNLTMIKLYNVIDKNIKNANAEGKISEWQANEIARWSLIRIYQIQNNSKFINAIKTYKALS